MKLLPRLPLLAACLFSLAAVATAQDPAAKAPIMPDPKLTPGEVLDVTLADIQEQRLLGQGAQRARVREAGGVRLLRHRALEQGRVRGGPPDLAVPRRQQLQEEPVARELPDRAVERPHQGRTWSTGSSHWCAPGRWICTPPSRRWPRTGSPPTRSTSAPSRCRRRARVKSAWHGTPGVPDTKPDGTESRTWKPSRHRRCVQAIGQRGRHPLGTDAGQVWVNTKSGVIWKPGSRYYGKTAGGQVHERGRCPRRGLPRRERNL